AIMSDQNFIRYFSPRTLTVINLGLIKLKPEANVEKTTQTLRRLLPEDVDVYTKAGIIEHDKNYWLQATSIGFIFGLGVLVSFIVGIVIVYQILFTDIRDHLPEYATMKAMGYRSQYLFNVVLQEAFILAVMGYIPGLIIALGLYEMTLRATAGTLPMQMTLSRVVLVLIMTALMCGVSGMISVRKAIATDPAEVF
ncbi:MAG: FtsX-like permease family protein, partial [Cyanobacteria bacterium P01_F01_bin.4]